MKTCLLLAACLLLAHPLPGQGFPPHEPLNPTSRSRSGLLAAPFEGFVPGRWRGGLAFEYGNAIDSDTGSTRSYLLDAELMRTTIWAAHDLSPRLFVRGDASVTGSYAGFADAFFVWYHGLIHFRQPERAARPRNQFAYEFRLPDGRQVTRPASALAIGDLRATVGRRFGQSLQSVVSLTLPTASGPEGYGRGTISLSTVQTVHVELSPRITYEGTLGLGLTPRHGQLSPYQRTVFASLSAGMAVRLWGAQSIYGSLYFHTPYYHDTHLRSLDSRELTADFGWVARERNGRGWYVVFTEDLAPGDPGIDLILKLGRTW